MDKYGEHKNSGYNSVPETRIAPASALGLMAVVREVWAFRGVMYRLLWRDLRIKYKQTVFGVLWALFTPMVLLATYSFFFGYLARFPSDGWPYPVFAVTGIVIWTFLARAIQEGANCLVANGPIMSRVYFPRLILPVNQIAFVFIDFLISLALLVPVLGYYNVIPDARLAFLPLLLLGMLLFAMGCVFWLSALNARYRDVGLVLPLAVQVWLFCSPVFYPLSIVPESIRSYYVLNPMVGILQGFRWVLGSDAFPPTVAMMSSTIGVTVLLTVSGLLYFNSVQSRIVDSL